jgi:hypothetical protein
VGNALALVALFDCSAEELAPLNPTHRYLAELAKRSRIEFFAQPDDWPGHRRLAGQLALHRHPESDAPNLSVLSSPAHREVAYSHWGINE